MADLFDHPSADPATRPQSDLDLGRYDGNPPGLTLRQLIREDYETHGRDFFSQGFWAIAIHRFGNWRMGVRSKLLRAPLTILYRILSKCVQWFGGIDLMYTVKVGRRVRHAAMMPDTHAPPDLDRIHEVDPAEPLHAF